METRRSRRTKRRRMRRIVASVTAVGAIGLSLGLALPAGASGRAGQSNAGCDSHYYRDSYQGYQHSNDASYSNEGWC